MVCTFFGHRDAPEEIRRELSSTIQKIVERDANCVFYVGNQGNFDRLVLTVLKELVENYPSIRYYIVLIILLMQIYIPLINKLCVSLVKA